MREVEALRVSDLPKLTPEVCIRARIRLLISIPHLIFFLSTLLGCVPPSSNADSGITSLPSQGLGSLGQGTGASHRPQLRRAVWSRPALLQLSLLTYPHHPFPLPHGQLFYQVGTTT